MAGSLNCEIVTPERSFFEQAAGFVVIPGASGDMGVYPMHAPTVTTLRPGVVKVVDMEGSEIKIAVFGGYAEVDEKGVIVLASRAAIVSELDVNEVSSKAEELAAEIAAMEQTGAGMTHITAELSWYTLLARLLESDHS